MFVRRSVVKMASQKASRTVVRDPRKPRKMPSAVVARQEEITSMQQQQQNPQPLPFSPSSENQQSIGSSLGSYALAGAGMAMGFVLVGAIFGV
jgi:hypothetical protein